MRHWLILAVLGLGMLAAAARGEEGSSAGGAFVPQGKPNPAAPASGDLPNRQPLGAFQPTDIGSPNLGSPTQGNQNQGQGGEDEPEPPKTLAPELDAAPVRGLNNSLQLNDSPQSVAPAQFQSPAAPPAKAKTDPKTTVVPAASAPVLQPVTPTEPQAASEPQNLAQQLYQQSLAPPASGAIQGTPLGLQQGLAQRTDSSRYAEYVKSYWKLSQLLAAYNDALQSALEMTRIPQPRTPHHQALLQAAGAAAEAEVRQARLQVISAQWELSDQMTATGTPPLPQDAPLTSAYKAKFDAVFAGRVAPAGARRLDATFDARLAVIEGRAAAVLASENAFGAIVEDYGKGQGDLNDVLRQHTLLQNARREFLRNVYDYNAAIAEYAWLAAGPNRSPETIAGMLVERKKPVIEAESVPANFVSP